MEVNITSQALEAAYALILGASFGLVYDLLSVFRRSVKANIKAVLIAAIFDAIFCMICAAGFFMLGFGPGKGKLRPFLLLFVIPGSALYFIFLSKTVTIILYGLLKIIRQIIKWCLFPFEFVYSLQKKIRKTIKKHLHYTQKWFTIEQRYVIQPSDRNMKGRSANAKDKAKPSDGGNYSGAVGFRDYPDLQHESKNRRRKKSGNRADSPTAGNPVRERRA
jgi:hypothetical protein